MTPIQNRFDTHSLVHFVPQVAATNSISVLRFILGILVVTGSAFAEDSSSRIKAAIIAGMPDYHGNPYPDVVDPPKEPPPRPKTNAGDGIELPVFKVDTTRLPPNRILVQPKIRNVFEKLLPGTGVTVTETKKGSKKTVGRVLFIPVFWDLRW